MKFTAGVLVGFILGVIFVPAWEKYEEWQRSRQSRQWRDKKGRK